MSLDSGATAAAAAKGNQVALFSMLLSMLCFSTMPLMFVVAGATEYPLMFAGLLTISSCACNVIYLFVQYREKWDVQTRRQIWSWVCHRNIVWVGIFDLDYLAFVVALVFIDAAVVAVLYELWPLFMVASMAWIFRKTRRYASVTSGSWLLFSLAFFGVALVVASQSPTVADIPDLVNYAVFFGVGLGVLAALFGGLCASTAIQWGDLVAETDGGTPKDRVFFTMVACVAMKPVVAAMLIGLSLFVGESVELRGVSIALLVGFVCVGIGSTAYRVANVTTTNLNLNALCFAVPVIALIWLWLFVGIDVPRVDWLGMGVAVIVVANVLLNVKVWRPE